MNFEHMVRIMSDTQLQLAAQNGSVPSQFIEGEMMRRQQLRVAAEGASTAPESLGLGVKQ